MQDLQIPLDIYIQKDKTHIHGGHTLQIQEKEIYGWRIDYFIVSNSLKKYIHEAYIYDKILGSDHCPVGLEMEE